MAPKFPPLPALTCCSSALGCAGVGSLVAMVGLGTQDGSVSGVTPPQRPPPASQRDHPKFPLSGTGHLPRAWKNPGRGRPLGPGPGS